MELVPHGQGCRACQAIILHISSPGLLPAPKGLDFIAAALELSVSSEEIPPAGLWGGKMSDRKTWEYLPSQNSSNSRLSVVSSNISCPFQSLHLFTLISRVPFPHFCLINPTYLPGQAPIPSLPGNHLCSLIELPLTPYPSSWPLL